MIIHLKNDISAKEAANLAVETESIFFESKQTMVLVTGSKVKEIPAVLNGKVADHFPMDSDIQLASRSYMDERPAIDLGTVQIGGDQKQTVVIAGPCSVESKEQLDQSARNCVDHGIKILRAGCYKPRTSPYSFQGLGLEGLQLLSEMRDQYGLKIITEVRDASHIEEVIEYADIVQIGAKAMYDQGILRRCAQIRKPVLIKRGFGSTLQEFVQAAEFVLSGGNGQVMLCERGIRTFETKTRFTLDLCGVAYLKEYTNLPVILDPSHAMGFRYGIADLARACTAMGVDGLLIEVHPNPEKALSDASQQLNFEQFSELYNSLDPVAKAVGYSIC